MLLIFPNHPMSCKAPPLGLGYIAAALEESGEKVEIVDCQICSDYKKKIINSLSRHSQVGISGVVGNFTNALDIAKLIRERSAQTKIIMGGHLPSAIYDKLIPEHADIVVIGEAEDTISELVNSNDLSSIRGIVYWDDNNLKINPPRPLISNLDRIRFPAWHLFNNYKNYRFRKSPHLLVASMITSRGCPYQCIYCMKIIHGSKIRLRSVDNVISEIDYLVARFNIKEFRIFDENFTFYPERVKELCEKIISRGYKNIRLALPTGIRADKGDKEMFGMMAKAGFYWIGFGIESGSQEVQTKIKHKLELNKAKEVVKIAKETGMHVHVQFMLGHPFDTLTTMQETIDFAKGLPVNEAHFSICIPFPGTELYKMVQNKGRFLEDLILQPTYHFSGKLCYEINNLKAKEVRRMYRKAYRDFYFRFPQIRWIFRRVIKYNLRQLIMIWQERKNFFFKS